MNIIIKKNVLMKKLCSYKLDGIVKTVLYPKDEETLLYIINYLNNKHINYKVLGKGTNIIFKDLICNTLIIKLDLIKYIYLSKGSVNVSSSYSLSKLSNELINMSCIGLSFASLIPGTVGASIYGNAGAYNKSISDTLLSVRCIHDGKVVIYNKDQINFDYRYSSFKDNSDVILSATFKLIKGNKEETLNEVNENNLKRRKSQPLEYPNAGSVFKNPLNNSAGKLIDECNLKGTNVNGAYVSDKHANFIINKDKCNGKDILDLIDIIKDKVKESYNIDLELEQEIIN